MVILVLISTQALQRYRTQSLSFPCAVMITDENLPGRVARRFPALPSMYLSRWILQYGIRMTGSMRNLGLPFSVLLQRPSTLPVRRFEMRTMPPSFSRDLLAILSTTGPARVCREERICSLFRLLHRRGAIKFER